MRYAGKLGAFVLAWVRSCAWSCASLVVAVAAASESVAIGAQVAVASESVAIGAQVAVASESVAIGAEVAPSPSVKRAVTYAVVQQPRLTGYFVGDLLIQRVLLERDGKPFTPAALPTAGRVTTWFERRRVTVGTDTNQRRWLVVEYQILNAPPKLTDVTVPAWQITVAGGSAASPPMTLTVPSVSINVAPLSPPGSPEQVGTRDLRPDRLPPVIPTAPIRRAVALSASALALTLIAWVGWVVWRNRRAVATKPFARALRELRTLDDREPGAWQALHRAFDRTAGRVVQSATLPALFERAPQLAPAREQIEEFFAQSSRLFFGGVAANGGSTSIKSASLSSGPRGRSEASSFGAAAQSIAAAGGTLAVNAAVRDATAGAVAVSNTTVRDATLGAAAISGATVVAATLPRALCIELRRIERRHEQ